MTRKMPDDAFAFYVALGPDQRSYELVGKHYGVNKKTVTRTAEREQWQARLEVIERRAREATDAKLAKDLHAMDMRHRKLLLGIASRAASAIQAFPLKTAMEGIKAAEIAIKLERLLAGEPTETRTISVEQVTREEVHRFLLEDGQTDEWSEGDESDDGDDESDLTAANEEHADGEQAEQA